MRTQLLTLMRYELRRHWRRRGLLLMTLIWLAATLVANASLMRGSAIPGDVPPALQALPDYVRVQHTVSLIMSGGGVATAFVILTLAVLAAEVSPLDHVHGAAAWHDALPLAYPVYLAGKVAGACAAAALSLVAVALVSALVARLLHGPFDLLVYLRLWLLLLLPIALFTAAFTALLGACFRSRRWAMLTALAAAVATYFVLTPLLAVAFARFYSHYLAAHVPPLRDALCAADGPCVAVADSAMTLPPYPLAPSTYLLLSVLLPLAAGLLAWARHSNRETS